MDMKKILQAFDSAAEKKPVAGANDMKKFLSIVNENANPYQPVEERVISGFEEGSVGGDANTFLIHADNISDMVMSEIDKIKINANPELLKDLMSKFNAFMTAYHSVGKEILQPDLFDNTMGETTLRDKEDLQAKRKALQDIQMDPNTSKDPDVAKAVIQRKADLEKEAKAKGLGESVRPGEYILWNVEFDDGSTGKIRVPSDEITTPEIKAHYAKQGKTVVNATTDWSIHGGDRFEPAPGQSALDKQYAQQRNLDRALDAQDRRTESLSFTDYFNLLEAKKDPCWKDYEQVGMKEKNGKKVPNCVPKK